MSILRNPICSICCEVTDKTLDQAALPAMMESSYHTDVRMVMKIFFFFLLKMPRPLPFGTFLKIHPFCYCQPSLADVDAEKCVDNSLVQIWKLKFGHKINFLSKNLNTKFGQDFEVEAQARF